MKLIPLLNLIACTCMLAHTASSQTPSARTHKIGLSATPINGLDIIRFANLNETSSSMLYGIKMGVTFSLAEK